MSRFHSRAGYGMIGLMLSMGIVVVLFGVMAAVLTNRLEMGPRADAPEGTQAREMSEAVGNLNQAMKELGMSADAVIEKEMQMADLLNEVDSPE